MSIHKIIISLSLCISCSNLCFSQITIEECYDKSYSNYPLIQQLGLIEKAKEYTISNASKGYLPQIAVSAKGSYQSEVTNIPIDFSKLGLAGMNIQSMSKDQYGATIDINQSIWDGGAIHSKKEVISSQAELEKNSTEVNMYTLRQRVNQLFFGILLADEQIKQNRLFQELLQTNLDRIEAYKKNGVANQSDVDAIRIDLLRSKQMMIQFQSNRNAFVNMLSALTGMKMDNSTILKMPNDAVTSGINKRPELKLFQSEMELYKSQNRQLSSDLMPRLSAFATGGYGRPGLNMLEDKFKTYYIAGLRLSWNIGSFYTNKNKKRLLENSIESVNNKQEIFLFNNSLDKIQKENDLGKFREQIKYDDEILNLRKSVSRASEAKMADGTMSGTDLMRDLNAEQQAAQDKILHQIEYLKAQYEMKYITNN